MGGADPRGRGMRAIAAGLLAGLSFAGLQALPSPQAGPPPDAQPAGEKAPTLTAEEEQKTFVLPPGYRAELVAKEPLVVDPIAMDFDADGRLWVLEMQGFMSEPNGANSREPINDVVVLEDTDDDGVMDKRTVFADKLVLPRAIKVLAGGVLVGEPPNLWLMKDTDGDLDADTRDLVSGSYGRAAASIEHNANSLLWAMDNVIYTSEGDFHLRMKHGRIETIPTLPRGQWGASMDDAGRVFRNVNDAPLFADFVAAHYYARNPNLVRTRGLYEPLISREGSTIWPVRATRGVNRGYRDQFFRPDGSSRTIQGVGSPVVYRGDQLPKELHGDVFITDSPTNLVHRYKVVDDGAGRLTAVDGYEKGEILAARDERFRPVNLLGAPDGALYVADMYRGVVQEQIYWTDFLKEYIARHDLQQPVHLGRIWRIVHESTRRQPRPALAGATPQQLVKALSHPNGWWRDMAQQLIVQRGDHSVVPQLEQLAAQSGDWRVRLHAMWTLDGLDAVKPDAVRKLLADRSPDVRAAAIRWSERWLDDPARSLAADVLKLADDSSWTVRRQLAATVGELPADVRVEQAARLLTRYGSDPILVDAAISGLHGSEAQVLERVLQPEVTAGASDAAAMLAGAVARRGDAGAVQQLVGLAADTRRIAWQRSAILHGLDAGLPAGGGGGRAGGARGGGGGRGTGVSAKIVVLPAEPTALLELAGAGGDAGTVARRVAGKLDWAGKPSPTVEVAALTPEEQKRYDAGAELYKGVCVGCHQPDGRGKEKLAPSLVDSAYVKGPDPSTPIRILLSGKEGAIGLMPPLGGALSDEQVASVLTYIRREWGHTATPVTPEEVVEVRGLTRTRAKPWTDAELQQERGGRGAGAGRGGQP
jgi:mono/diheme cytochrome c family protein/glucose/arabinose dehydrogenase